MANVNNNYTDNFNTSHVNVNLACAVLLSTSKEFQYISC